MGRPPFLFLEISRILSQTVPHGWTGRVVLFESVFKEMSDSLSNGFKHHVFLSYCGSWRTWIRENFIGIFKFYLGQAIGDPNPSIYCDAENAEHGVGEWPSSLAENLAKARILVPLFSKTYFSSDWCKTEFDLMRQREDILRQKYGNNTISLIAPAWIHDGDHVDHGPQMKRFQEFYGRYNPVRMNECTWYRRITENSQKWDILDERARELAEKAALYLQNTPEDFDPAWRNLTAGAFEAVYKAHEEQREQAMRKFHTLY